MLPDGFYELADHYALELPGARAAFSTRRGGFSDGPYRSLNLGLLTDDDQQAVARNRAALELTLGAPPLSFVHQVHGAEVRRVASSAAAGRTGGGGSAGDGGRTGGGIPPAEPPRADGQATDRRDLAPAALVADCLPVAVAGGGAAAMLHAGWRGLAGGVLEAGVAAVRALAGPGAGVLEAAIGPGAGPCCYEVGDEVHAAFAGIAEAHVGRRLDLKAIARRLLERAGVAAVHDIGMCTICADPSLLFSHRRDRGLTGRQAGVVWLI